MNLINKQLEESEPATQFPGHVLVLYPSEKQTYDHQTGPFHPICLIVHANGTWTLQCPIYEHIVINEGNLPTLEETSLLKLAEDLLCSDRTFCHGMLEDFNELGYKPENIRVMAGPVRSRHSNSFIHDIPPLLVKIPRALQIQGQMHRTLGGNEFVLSA